MVMKDTNKVSSIAAMKLVKEHREQFDSTFEEAQAAVEAGWTSGKSRDGLAEIPPCLTFIINYKSGAEHVEHICNANDTTGMTAEDVEEQGNLVLEQFMAFKMSGDIELSVCRINNFVTDFKNVDNISFVLSSEMSDDEFDDDEVDED